MPTVLTGIGGRRAARPTDPSARIAGVRIVGAAIAGANLDIAIHRVSLGAAIAEAGVEGGVSVV
ncbi:MAG: hypothetical protein AB7O24_26510 [Kofleriaceae bacterium]